MWRGGLLVNQRPIAGVAELGRDALEDALRVDRSPLQSATLDLQKSGSPIMAAARPLAATGTRFAKIGSLMMAAAQPLAASGT